MRICTYIHTYIHTYLQFRGYRSIRPETLQRGAEKISINSPALENPNLISKLAKEFGVQCVVVGVDSMESEGDYLVYQYTGDEVRITNTKRRTLDWVKKVQDLGAGEILLNSIDRDGSKKGYDIKIYKFRHYLIRLKIICRFFSV